MYNWDKAQGKYVPAVGSGPFSSATPGGQNGKSLQISPSGKDLAMCDPADGGAC